MVDGMDHNSKLISVDNDPKLCNIVKSYFDHNQRVNIVCSDGKKFIKNYRGKKFDLIFSDTWPGKYSMIYETLLLLNHGGMYIVDDMIIQANWPEDHQGKVDDLIQYLENRDDLTLTKMNWSTGVIIATKIK